jgi:hypothetical protein
METETAQQEYARIVTEIALRKAQPGRSFEQLKAMSHEEVSDLIGEELVYSLNTSGRLRSLEDQIKRGEGHLPYKG